MYRHQLAFLFVAALCACRSGGDHSEPARRGNSDIGGSGDYSDAASRSAGPEETTVHTREASAERAISEAERQFVAHALASGIFEVESSRIALEKGLSDFYRDFARTMVDDHGRTNLKLTALAQRKGIKVSDEMTHEQQLMIEELQSLSGAEFEARYHKIQVDAHDDAIALFERAGRELTDADLRDFATSTLPKLREHRSHLDRQPR
jgi:putative membrane protein